MATKNNGQAGKFYQSPYYPFSRIKLGLAHEGGWALDDAYDWRSRMMASVMS
ncbi:hypothetical protein [Pseudomonas arsenicoxydans]|uniref:hypothetical protein n=1 Tax=Pseudomonas arsenicoxydans TaxID=702115 RepID=UPI0012FD385A|nr:hypothetical protein [Pseudomonas arsenicoxydans]